MHDLAVEKVRDGREADVRMRPHIDSTRDAFREFHRAHVVEEHEWADAATLRMRQHASHLESAEIPAALVNHEFDHEVLSEVQESSWRAPRKDTSLVRRGNARESVLAPSPCARGDRTMPTDLGSGVIAHAIQLAIAPVFLLTGVAGLLNVMAARLARVIDRVRSLDKTWPGLDAGARAAARVEIGNLEARRRICSWSINLSTVAALLICLVIVALFVEEFFGADLKWLAGALFVAAMVALIGGLACFLREVYLATHTTSVDLSRFK
jgi:hypothetical protein